MLLRKPPTSSTVRAGSAAAMACTMSSPVPPLCSQPQAWLGFAEPSWKSITSTELSGPAPTQNWMSAAVNWACAAGPAMSSERARRVPFVFIFLMRFPVRKPLQEIAVLACQRLAARQVGPLLSWKRSSIAPVTGLLARLPPRRLPILADSGMVPVQPCEAYSFRKSPGFAPGSLLTPVVTTGIISGAKVVGRPHIRPAGTGRRSLPLPQLHAHPVIVGMPVEEEVVRIDLHRCGLAIHGEHHSVAAGMQPHALLRQRD